LAKLHLHEDLDDWKIRSLLFLVIRIPGMISLISFAQGRPLADATSNNALLKFETSVRKMYGDRAEPMNDGEHAELHEFAEIAQWLETVQEDLNGRTKLQVASKQRERTRQMAEYLIARNSLLEHCLAHYGVVSRACAESIVPAQL
jgi:hypothetical protein